MRIDRHRGHERLIAAVVLAVAISFLSTTARADAGSSLPTVSNVSNSPNLAEAEESIAINPANPANLLIGSNVFEPLTTAVDLPAVPPVGTSGVTDTALWRSEDFGLTWTPVTGLRPSGIGTITNPSGIGPAGFIDPGNGATADQDVVFDRTGRAIYESVDFGTSTSNVTIDVYTSVDGGRTWTEPVPAVTVTDTVVVLDRPFLAVDTSGGPRDGTIYLTWETIFFDMTKPQVFVTSSTDHGHTWGSVVRVDDDAHPSLTNPRQEVAVDGNGTLYDLYAAGSASQLVADPGGKELSLTLALSHDGGRSFLHSTVADHIVRATTNEEGDPLLDALTSALAADPRRAGHLTVAWPDASNGTARILTRTSVDSGGHWSPVTDITGLPADRAVECSNVRVAYIPDGRVAIVWRDRRFSGGDMTDPFDVWLRVLAPDGSPLADPRRLTMTSQPPTTGHHGLESGYIGVATGEGFVAVTWDQMSGRLSDNVITTVTISEPPYGLEP